MFHIKNLSIADNIVFPAFQLGNRSRKAIVCDAENLMKKMGIISVADHNIRKVSGGQLQRAAICRAMINRPDILFGDEPTGALDSSSTKEVMDILEEINFGGTTILLVTHDAKVASRADRIIYLEDGKIKDEFYNLSAAAKKNSPWQTQRSRSITDSNLNNTVLCAGPNGLKAYYYIYWIAGAERYVHNTLVYSTSNPTVNAHGTNNGAQITWGKVSGVPKYRVYKKVNGSWKKLGDTKGTSFVDKSAKAGNTYYYTVRGVTGDSSAFMTGYNTSGKALRFLYTPQITKLETSDVGIKLTWNNAYTGVKYRVYFKNSSGKWQNLGDVSGSSVNCYCYGSGGKFTYTVRAVSSDGKQFLSGYNTSGKGMKWVSTPQISSLYNTSGGVQLSWNKPTGTEKFRIYRKTGNGSWQKLADTTATSFKDSSASNGVTYSYTVRCISSSGKSFQSYYNTTGKKITCYR